MNRALLVRFIGLYIPVLVALPLALLRRRAEKLFPAVLLGFVWSLPSLLMVQLLNQNFGWWRFHAQGGLLCGMPLDLYLGWAVLWGVLPILAFRRTNIWFVTSVFVGLDVVLMPACRPVLELDNTWLLGEFVALGFVLLPAQFISRWTLNDSRLKGRAALQVLGAAGIFLFLIPEIVFALRPGRGWNAFLIEPAWLRNLELQAVALVAAFGVSAVQEFALRGRGTPIPYDPPRRLVVSGLYRYVANPMQISCVLTLSFLGLDAAQLVGRIHRRHEFRLRSWDCFVG
jgi:hypothetical protein